MNMITMNGDPIRAILDLSDFAALCPLLIILIGALLILLTETFFANWAKKGVFPIAVSVIILAMIAAYFSSASESKLLTPWIVFDPLARVFTLLFLSIGLAVTLLSSPFFHRFEATHEGAIGEYYFFLLSTLFGLILIGSSADFLTLFLGLETLSLALYALCGYMKHWSISHEASLKYFLMGALAAAFLVYGIALIYGAIGTTRFDALLSGYQYLHKPQNVALFMGGIALVTLALCFKAAIFPFHQWAPDVYDGAPTPVTALMSVGTKAGAFAGLSRVFLVALPNFNPIWGDGVAILAMATLIYGNTVAIQQTQLRRFFAYSGISHAGFLLIPLVSGGEGAISSLVFYLVVYAFATLGAFAALTFIEGRTKGVIYRDLHGLFKKSPLLAGLLALSLLTLAGIPPTAGFFAKFYLFKIAFQSGQYPLVIVGLLTTIISAFYYLRMIAMMLSEAPKETAEPVHSWPATIVGVFAGVAIIVFSCFPAPFMALLSI